MTEIDLESKQDRRDDLPLKTITWLACTVIAGAITLLVWAWP